MGKTTSVSGRCENHRSGWVLDVCDFDGYSRGCEGLLGVDGSKYDGDLLGLLQAVRELQDRAPNGRCPRI